MNEQTNTDMELAAFASNCSPEGLPRVIHRLRERFGKDVLRDMIFDHLIEPTEAERPHALQVGAFLKFVGNPPPMLIDRLVPDKRLILLTGKPKQGKSFFGIDIGDAVCCARAVAGEYVVNNPGPVLYIGMEDGPHEIANRFYQRGVRINSEDKSLYIVSQRLVVSTPEGIATLEKLIKDDLPTKPVLIIIDTAREGLGIKDWNDAAELTEKIRPLRDFAREVCSVLLIAHNRKAGAIDDGDEIAGSGAFASSVDGWISVQKAETQTNNNRRMWLKIVGRGGMHSEAVVEMDTNTLHFRTVSEQELDEGYQATKDAKNEKRYEFVVRAINSQPKRQATVQKIGDLIGQGYETARKLVQEMEDAKILEKTGTCEKSSDGARRPAAIYRLVAQTAFGA